MAMHQQKATLLLVKHNSIASVLPVTLSPTQMVMSLLAAMPAQVLTFMALLV
jgi:hypothetical protein